MEFTKDEIRDLIISIIALIIIFSWKAFPDFGLNIGLLRYFVIIIIISFLLREIAHKIVAKKFGLSLVYKMWPQGTLIGLILMIIGFKFVAPGVIIIHAYKFSRWGYRRPKLELATAETGLTALAGPATNLFLGLIFSLFGGTFFYYLAFINVWLAFVNLLPIPSLDGSKVLIWKPWIWGFLTLISFVLVLML